MESVSGAAMNGPLLLLITCYALVALLLLALCLYTRWSFWVKTSAILLTGMMFSITYETMAGLLGFPTPGKMPERFVFHHAVVIQPDKNTSSKGTIFIWASELTKDGPAKAPRAYEFPYAKDTNATIVESVRRTKQGIMQLGMTIEDGPKATVNTFTKFMSSSRLTKIKMQDMPEPALPEK